MSPRVAHMGHALLHQSDCCLDKKTYSPHPMYLVHCVSNEFHTSCTHWAFGPKDPQTFRGQNGQVRPTIARANPVMTAARHRRRQPSRGQPSNADPGDERAAGHHGRLQQLQLEKCGTQSHIWLRFGCVRLWLSQCGVSNRLGDLQGLPPLHQLTNGGASTKRREEREVECQRNNSDHAQIARFNIPKFQPPPQTMTSVSGLVGGQPKRVERSTCTDAANTTPFIARLIKPRGPTINLGNTYIEITEQMHRQFVLGGGSGSQLML